MMAERRWEELLLSEIPVWSDGPLSYASPPEFTLTGVLAVGGETGYYFIGDCYVSNVIF